MQLSYGGEREKFGANYDDIVPSVNGENIDNRMRIMPVELVDGSWGVIDSNDFTFFTRYFR